MSDLPKITDVIEVQEISQAEFNRVSPWGSEPKEDNGWISCEDKFPCDKPSEEDYAASIHMTVIAVLDTGVVLPMYFHWRKAIGGATLIPDWYGHTHLGLVTHWQPLPLPPMLREQAS